MGLFGTFAIKNPLHAYLWVLFIGKVTRLENAFDACRHATHMYNLYCPTLKKDWDNLVKAHEVRKSIIVGTTLAQQMVKLAKIKNEPEINFESVNN